MKKLLILVTLSLVVLSCQTKVKKEYSPTAAEVTTVKLELKVDGMTCEGCEMTIKMGLEKLDGVVEVKANHESGTVFFTVDTTIIGRSKVVASIEELGYRAR